jgi:hypothetical protein
MGQVTRRASTAARADVFRKIIEIYAAYIQNTPDVRIFLMERYLQLAAKSGKGRADFKGVIKVSPFETFKSSLYYFGFCLIYFLKVRSR